jgi:superfamily II DNA or RNA helicase
MPRSFDPDDLDDDLDELLDGELTATERRDRAVGPDVHFPPAVWASLLAAANVFPSETRGRGQRYAQDGHVRAIHATDDRIDAIVVGTDTYEVVWQKAGQGWATTCTCPVGRTCKHAYAAVWFLVLRGQRRRVPERGPPARAAVPPRLAGRRADAVDLLGQIRSATEPWILQDAVVRLVQQIGGAGLSPYAIPFHELAAEPDPELRCWRLTEFIASRTGGVIPRALYPYRDRADLAARHTERVREELARDVVAWAGRLRRGPERRLRVVLGLVRRSDGSVGVVVEPRLSTARLADAPRTLQQLQHLQGELANDPAVLTPEEAAIVYWLTAHAVGGASTRGAAVLPSANLGGLLERIVDSPLGAWSDTIDPALAAAAGVVPGGRIQLSSHPVRLVPDAVERDDQTWLGLCYVWADGRRRDFDQVVRVERGYGTHAATGLVIADGQFSTVVSEPPAHLVDRFRETRGVPLSGATRVPLLRQLARGFPHLLETLRTHTRTHAVEAAIVLELHDEEWLQIRVLATPPGWRPGGETRTDGAHFEYVPDHGWTRLAVEPALAAAVGLDVPVPPSAAEPGDEPIAQGVAAAVPVPALDGGEPSAVEAVAPTVCWADEPDAPAVESALAWLEEIRSGAGTARAAWAQPPEGAEQQGGWWFLLNPKRLEQVADAWAHRPVDVSFYGTTRVRRLLEGAEVVPRLRVDPSGVDWFSVSAEWHAEGLALSEDDLATLRAAKTRFVKLSTGWTDRAATGQQEAVADVLADLGIEAGSGPERISVWQLAGARPESLRALERIGLDAETLRSIEQLRARVEAFEGLPAVPPAPGFTADLRSYQTRGVEFLNWTAGLGLGAILADDMGLGKTVQALGWLAHLRATDPEGGPSLVVCPASVVHNWERETARFLPGWRVLVLGRGEERHAQRADIAQFDLVITNYALLRHDIDAWREVSLRVAILDEAQNIKNPDAAVTRAALGLRAKHRLVLTGTPLENRALDLWSLMNFASPGYLGSRKEFAARYDRADTPPHRRALLAARLRPVLLRRLKREVAQELPERIEERRDCELSPGQRKLYLAELRRSQQLVQRLDDRPAEFNRQRIQILAALTRLRQICCHPKLAGGAANLGSGKFEALFELLEPLLAEGHKVLVFSQFVECLKLLAGELKTRAIPHHLLTGQTVKRAAVVQAFTDDPKPCVFLVSLKAGGTGLNLTAASYVVLFDPWWNPAVEAQAIDRVHRIGQDKTVVAYRLVASGTIEDKIWELQQRKAALVQDVLGESGFGRALTRDDLAYLFERADEVEGA